MSLLKTNKTLISVAVASACIAMPALAQDTAAATPRSNSGEAIAEVVVTATRHSTSLLRTPV